MRLYLCQHGVYLLTFSPVSCFGNLSNKKEENDKGRPACVTNQEPKEATND